MLDEYTPDRTPHLPPDDGGKGLPRKISFDDFEIEGTPLGEPADKPKGIPRIKNLKDDLLGGGKKLSKIFGSANDAPVPAEPDQHYLDETESPADIPYFSEEELSLVRVRKSRFNRSKRNPLLFLNRPHQHRSSKTKK